MPLAYYSRAASAMFWSEHWGRHSVEELLLIARTSPLTELIQRHLPPGGPLLEAGCGVGQYVLLLRERGHAAVGVDWSFDAVSHGVRAGAPLAVMDLRALGVRDQSVSAYLSLGVVEHDPTGPDAIVAEAARVLIPNGTLLLSVPYWNGVRRLFASCLTRRNRAIRAAGGEFYQFAFTRREIAAFLEARGFTVRSFHPYDPARLLRKAVRISRATRPDPFTCLGPRASSAASDASTRTPALGTSTQQIRRALRRLLYAPPVLRVFGHMIMAVAVRQ